MKNKLSFIFAAFFGLMLSHITALAANSIPAIDVAKLDTGDQTLNVGYMKNFPPFYTSDGNPPKGMDADIFQAVAKNAGIKRLNFMDFDNFSALDDALNSGKIDIIVNDYWDFPKHEKEFLLTVPYFVRDGIAFVFQTDKHNFKTAADLKGQPVGVYKKGSDLVTWVKEHPMLKNVTIYDSSDKLMQDLKDDKISAAFVYYSLFLYDYGQRSHKVNLTAVLAQPVPSTYALRKEDTALQAKLNQTLETMWRNGRLAKLKAKYLKEMGLTEPRSYK